MSSNRWLGHKGPQALPYALQLPTMYGHVLVNRYDTNQTDALLKTGFAWDKKEIDLFCQIAAKLPEGSVFLDVGANFGLYSLAVAHVLRTRGGRVIAYEAQRMLAYMIAGTAALNGLENLQVTHCAVGSEAGKIDIPGFDYRTVSSFGSVEFGATQREYIGQPRNAASEQVDVVSLDSFNLSHVHLLKIDVEGMECAVLDGASQLISSHQPLILIEWIKSDKAALRDQLLSYGYQVHEWETNFLCLTPEQQENFGIRFQN